MNTIQTTLISECRQLMNDQQYLEVIKLLKMVTESHPDKKKLPMIGLAYFHTEQYKLAANAYKMALTLDPSNKNWQEMMQQSSSNYIAELNVPVPDIYFFEKDQLLSAPIVPIGTLPSSSLIKNNYSLLKRFRIVLGNMIGSVATIVIEFLTNTIGVIAGYRGRVWTNWYRRPMMLGILTLAYMREKMNKENLVSTYPDGALVGFQSSKLVPPEGVKYFRTAHGSWNNLKNPKEGAAGTRFARNINLYAIEPETGVKLLTPNPRTISRKLLTRPDEGIKEIPFLNMLAACWIQFQNGDWINHGETIYKDIIEVPLEDDDPARKKYWQTNIMVPRTQPDPTRLDHTDEDAPISFINEVTHWWDGSQIYGSDQVTVDRLRSHIDGKLKVNSDGTLPLDKKGIEETGFVRNWWVGMSMLHTLFTREHNAICDHLKKHYNDWDDARLFNVARLINAALMAKIHSVEWTPAVLPNKGLDTALNANWYGILTNLFEKGSSRKTVSEINVRNPELGGVVGNPINKHDVPFALTQEFVEVYRLHSLLPETLKIKKMDGTYPADLPFVETRQAGSAKLTKKVSMSDLFYSFGNQHPGQLVLNNYPKFMQELSIPFNPLFDLGAVDIIRARERGVPRYNEFRRQLGLSPISCMEDLTDNPEQIKMLKEVYGSGPGAIEMVDLLIGTLSESQPNRPSGFGFGETMFQIFILNATRRLQADRFYTDCYTEEYYTKEGLDYIDQTDLKTVILRHYPELAKSGLGNIKNAFEPWDTDEKLNPSKHPLREWDKSLGSDPWKGDLYKKAVDTAI